MRNGLRVACLLCVVWGLAVSGAQEISADATEYNFGSIKLGLLVKHTFVLQNTGDEPLDIIRVRASCGCTTTDLPKSRLSPGETVPLEVLVLADHGTSKNVSIYVYTTAPDMNGVANDDRQDHDLKLYVRGAITPKQAFETAPFELAYDMMLLVDVRDASAYEANHLMGAVNIPAADLTAHLSSLPRNPLIVVYDLAGEAADSAVQTLVQAGFMSSYYLQGGISRWVEVQGDRYLVNATPLPSGNGTVSGGASGRPYNQGTLNSQFYVLIDLRDAESFAAGHVIGALNIPFAELSQWIGRLPTFGRIILYDEDGSLSVQAYQTLVREGFGRPSVLLGGMEEWRFQYGDDLVTQL